MTVECALSTLTRTPSFRRSQSLCQMFAALSLPLSQPTPLKNHTCRVRFPSKRLRTQRQLSAGLFDGISEFLGGVGSDPGHWNYSPEWWGTQDGGWGRDEGVVVYSQDSACGNGQVCVTAHEATPVDSPIEDGDECPQEWRVLRFNGTTRQSVNRVSLAQSGIAAHPDCLAFEYLKTMAGIGSALMQSANLDGAFNACFVGGGGFSLPHCFSFAYPTARFEAVEVDPVVIEAAKQHMGVVPYPNMKIIEGDAVDHTAQLVAGGERLDLVVIDAFDGEDRVPDALCQPGCNFLKDLALLLHQEHGIVIVNVHGGPKPQRRAFGNPFGSASPANPGFDTNSALGKLVVSTIEAYSAEIVGTGGSGTCFSISTPCQDNIIMCVARELDFKRGEEAQLGNKLKVAASQQAPLFKFDVVKRVTESLTIWS